MPTASHDLLENCLLWILLKIVHKTVCFNCFQLCMFQLLCNYAQETLNCTIQELKLLTEHYVSHWKLNSKLYLPILLIDRNVNVVLKKVQMLLSDIVSRNTHCDYVLCKHN